MLDYKPKEELIALIQRQESELAASHDENERLKAALKQEQATIGQLTLELAARQPLADSFVAPFDLTCVINWLENGCDPKEAAKELRIYQGRMSASAAPLVTVDTPEFQAAVGNWRASLDYFQSDEDPYVIENWNSIIAHIDAHTARAVAAADKGSRQNLARMLGLGVNEPHSFAWDYLLTLVGAAMEDQPAQPVAGELPPLTMSVYGTRTELEAERQRRAAQRVQQPAAVTVPEGWKLVPREMSGEQLREVMYNINRKYKGNPLGEDFARLVWQWALHTAPVPSAGVQGDAIAECVPCNGHGATHYPDGEWEGKCAACKGTGVQPDSVQADVQVDMAGLIAWSQRTTAGVHGDSALRRKLEDYFAGHDISTEEMMAWVKIYATVQPDSGRDAALWDANAEGYMTGLRVGLLEGASIIREVYVNHVFHTGVQGLDARCKEAEQVLIGKANAALAAHPANGAQADDAAKIRALQLARAHLDWSLNGDDIHKIASTIDAAILAAAKKGGN